MWREMLLATRFAWHRVTHRDGAKIRRVLERIERTRHTPSASLSDADKGWVQQIRAETARHNRNNVTRTRAYLEFYKHHEEIHWALLAHMVSRNGGWSMTDVRGEWFPRIASQRDANRFFAFLERSNWLIFSDAFPQLLLYGEGKHSGRPWTHLLPHLGVSRFMQAMWDDFHETGDSELLTNALIVNEQNFIESRVVKNAEYSQAVLDSMQYRVQSVLGLNHVLIPYCVGSEVRLSGTVVKHFGLLDERISTGKRLYGLLFRDRLQRARMRAWMEGVVHTGSRSDFWPDIFTPHALTGVEEIYQPKLLAGNQPRARIYSPRLLDVWPTVEHEAIEPGDWFYDSTSLVHLFEGVSIPDKDFTDTYVQGLRTIEGILVAQDKVSTILSGSKSH